MRRCLPVFLLGFFLACDPAGSGCQLAPLQRDLDSSSLGYQAIEFYLPAGSASALGAVTLDLLAARDSDCLHGTLPALTGSLGGPLEFASSPVDLVVAVTGLRAELAQGRIRVELDLEAVDETLSLEVFSDGDLLRTCFLDLAVPQRSLSVGLIVESDYSGKLRIRVEGDPLLTNGAMTTELEVDCPQQPGSVVDPTVAEAVETFYAQTGQQLSLDLAGSISRFLGLDAGFSGSLGPAGSDLSAHGIIHPGPLAEMTPAGSLRLGLTGGIESEQAECIPAGAPQQPPASEPGADFKNFAPVTGESYTMGISISHGFLAQVLAAAYRGGLLCRIPSAGDLPGIDLAGLFASLEVLEDPDTVRAALWPGQPPNLDFSNPALHEGEMLPRAILEFNRLGLDVYAAFEGADVRLLGLQADVILKLVPVLDGENLYFWPAEVQSRDLQVTFAGMIAESGSDLRSGAAQVLERVMAAIIENTPPVQIPRPAGAAGELLGAESVNGRLVLYFNP